ncbi:nucleotidyl transferase AbiEii/AbiGii toxin family protein [Devosia algicola]|uniref:Nucleotidyl transferase AbiEii/AbiGii toxin family protein n=1 Tax=Devosia algicola TaxID=3026418 RepID=A0ABY7YKM6_9HYPH|nr:nucleotidyl transferase AbiEii/AbiGii toxin family protein [Devosia algicola]WDR01629.1 nucleotidyl transferase AbiEii/AbiGii toxin family protein [Devosia algicola]
MKFERPQHIIIQSALQSMDAAFLQRSNCYFGGGTAIVLMNGEYRLSLDVDFLCADIDGYRDLRSAIRDGGAHAVFGAHIETVREFKADQYGIRGVVSLEGQPIKFEIVREARIPLDGALVEGLGVPVLTIESQFSEKAPGQRRSLLGQIRRLPRRDRPWLSRQGMRFYTGVVYRGGGAGLW